MGWLPATGATPRQLKLFMAGIAGIYALVLAAVGTATVVAYTSDAVSLEVSGGGGDIWLNYQLGFQGMTGWKAAPFEWSGHSDHLKNTFIESAAGHDSGDGTPTGCRIIVNGKVAVQHTATHGSVRCAVDLTKVTH